MTLYKIQLKLKSPLVTSLKGDTIWGHFVWGIANHEGEDAVAKFLEECKSANPPLIVSSAFFKGTVCRPLPLPKPHEKMTPDKYADIKKNKKLKSISADKVFDGKGNADALEGSASCPSGRCHLRAPRDSPRRKDCRYRILDACSPASIGRRRPIHLRRSARRIRSPTPAPIPSVRCVRRRTGSFPRKRS